MMFVIRVIPLYKLLKSEYAEFRIWWKELSMEMNAIGNRRIDAKNKKMELP